MKYRFTPHFKPEGPPKISKRFIGSYSDLPRFFPKYVQYIRKRYPDILDITVGVYITEWRYVNGTVAESNYVCNIDFIGEVEMEVMDMLHDMERISKYFNVRMEDYFVNGRITVPEIPAARHFYE